MNFWLTFGYFVQTPASRVVLIDTHFNPTVSTQSIFRAYRYGQNKPVFVYRLLTEGTMEERVYGRCVNKTGVALRVVDGKTIKRSFSKTLIMRNVLSCFAALSNSCNFSHCS
jgi:SNF2 family DNA or RNA helicase